MKFLRHNVVAKSANVNRTKDFRILWVHSMEQSAFCFERLVPLTERVQATGEYLDSDKYRARRNKYLDLLSYSLT